MKKLLTILFVICSTSVFAQKVESIYFNLYTDSLKIGVHNYINVDGKLVDGSFLPLMSDQVEFKSSIGKWEGNSLILDSSIKADSVIITACFKEQPTIIKKITIYIKKGPDNTTLPTEEEIIDSYRKQNKKKRN